MKCTGCGQEIKDDTLYCPFCGIEVVQEKGQQTKKKPNLMKVGIALAVITVVVAAAFIFRAVSMRNVVQEKYLVYMKDNAIYYVDNMTKDKEPIIVSKVRLNDGMKWNDLRVTEDGKYLYYYSKMTSNGNLLCCAELGKLKDDEDKNEKYIEEISSGVTSYQILPGDKRQLLYLKDNGRLVFYSEDGEEDIAKGVESYYLSENNQIAFYKIWDEGDATENYYFYNLSNGDKNKIAGNASQFYATSLDFIVYTAIDDEYNYDLYTSDAEGKGKKIASNVYAGMITADTSGKSVYYITQRVESKKLYDYVDDAYAAADANITEPKDIDYLKPATERDAMSEEDYDYYSLYPEDKHWFYEDLYYLGEWDLYYRWNYETGRYYYYNENENKWYSFDNDSYDRDYEAYNQVKDRIMLRNELKDYTIENPCYDLYLWEAGKEPVLVAENIIEETAVMDAKNHIALYQKAKEVSVKIPIEEVYSASDVEWRIRDAAEDETGARNTYYTMSGKENELDIQGNPTGIELSQDGKTVMIYSGTYEGSCGLTVYSVQNGILKNKENFADAEWGGKWSNNEFYYFKNVVDDYASVYCYKNGTEKKIINNVYIYDARLYSDGAYSAFKDYSDNYGGSLRIGNINGEETKVASDIRDYTYITEKCIVYRNGSGTLYVYTGEDKDKRIAHDVITYDCKAADSILLGR